MAINAPSKGALCQAVMLNRNHNLTVYELRLRVWGLQKEFRKVFSPLHSIKCLHPINSSFRFFSLLFASLLYKISLC